MTAKLPHGDLAMIDVRKLEDYLLSEVHPRGRHKARCFVWRLGCGGTMRPGFGLCCWKPRKPRRLSTSPWTPGLTNGALI